MELDLGLGDKTILCIDDNAHMLSALRRLLVPLGYRITTASGGAEGVRLAAEAKPDLVILDVMMPGMGGYEVLGGLRAAGLEETPVVMLTGQGSVDNVMKGYAQGCVCYITKPFKNEHVVNVVQYLIGDLSEEERARLELSL